MSASLVGSEMCIRDRSPTCNLSLWKRTPRITLKHMTSRSSAKDRIARIPVSYTHLTLPTICSV
eukprot:14382693-Alexandrium_andersonii.AAC.1